MLDADRETEAKIVADERAEEILDEWREYISHFNDERAIKNLDILSINADGELVGANTFTAIGLAQIEPEGKRIATLADLGRISTLDNSFFDGIYTVAPAVVLRSNDDSYRPNKFNVRDLTRKLAIRNFERPHIITGLALEESTESHYGLAFVQTGETRIIGAPALAYRGSDYFRFSGFDENGLPIPNEEGDECCWVRKDGVCRVIRGEYGYWGARWVDLDDSDARGRVVEIGAEGDARNSEPLVLAPEFREMAHGLIERTKHVRTCLDSEDYNGARDLLNDIAAGFYEAQAQISRIGAKSIETIAEARAHLRTVDNTLAVLYAQLPPRKDVGRW
jgi:hypothetical protein